MSKSSTPEMLDFQKKPYRSKVSSLSLNSKFLDRIDIHCEVPLVDFRELSSIAATGDKSETIREQVEEAPRMTGQNVVAFTSRA